MKNKFYKKENVLKLIFSTLFGLTSILLYGQPDPPPNEVPLDNNIIIMFIIAIVFSGIVFVKNFKSKATN